MRKARRNRKIEKPKDDKEKKETTKVLLNQKGVGPRKEKGNNCTE